MCRCTQGMVFKPFLRTGLHRIYDVLGQGVKAQQLKIDAIFSKHNGLMFSIKYATKCIKNRVCFSCFE